MDRQLSLKRKISETLTKKYDENDKKEKFIFLFKFILKF